MWGKGSEKHFIFRVFGSKLSWKQNGLGTSHLGHAILKMHNVKMRNFPTPGSIQGAAGAALSRL